MIWVLYNVKAVYFPGVQCIPMATKGSFWAAFWITFAYHLVRNQIDL